MMSVLSKIVATLVSPLGTALVLGLVALLLARSRQRFAAALGVLALAWLWGWSLPVASDRLRASLEDEAGPRTVEAVPAAPAMVVLGGAVAGARAPWRPYPDLLSASDRLWHAARLYRAGKAPLVVLSGGTIRQGEMPEAPAMRQFLSDMGVPAGAMLIEDRSTNTTENATETARLLRARRIHRVLLVTSALHMRRARPVRARGAGGRAGVDRFRGGAPAAAGARFRAGHRRARRQCPRDEGDRRPPRRPLRVTWTVAAWPLRGP